MGYQTSFDFSNNSPEVIRAIENISGYSESENGEYFHVKWYDWVTHLKSVSILFPSQVIIISGEGEEQGDVWRAYFKNGKSVEHRPEFVWPKFDLEMLT